MSERNLSRKHPKVRKTDKTREPVKTSYKKGKVKTGGRKVGSPTTRMAYDVKQAVVWAINENGGAEYIKRLMKANPRGTMVLLGKMMPNEITGANGGPIQVDLIQKAQTGIANLDDSEIRQLAALMNKMGIGQPGVPTGRALIDVPDGG